MTEYTLYTNVTPCSQAEQFSYDLVAENAILRCKYCTGQLLSLKLSTIVNHLSSESHLEKKQYYQIRQIPILRQTTVPEAVTSRSEHCEFVKDVVIKCISTNIPLEWAPKMQKKVNN